MYLHWVSSRSCYRTCACTNLEVSYLGIAWYINTMQDCAEQIHLESWSKQKFNFTTFWSVTTAFPTWGNHCCALDGSLQALISQSNTSSRCVPRTSVLTKDSTSMLAVGFCVSNLQPCPLLQLWAAIFSTAVPLDVCQVGGCFGHQNDNRALHREGNFPLQTN